MTGDSFTIPGVFAVRVGDKLTIENIYRRNPLWRWWKFWQPKTLPELQTFVVVA